MDDITLENIYQERLDERIIEYLASKRNIDYKAAMDIFYNNRLAEKIHLGEYGIQYLDHKVLVQILEETEPELFV